MSFSKTACREFESYYPCHKKALYHNGYKVFLFSLKRVERTARGAWTGEEATAAGGRRREPIEAQCSVCVEPNEAKSETAKHKRAEPFESYYPCQKILIRKNGDFLLIHYYIFTIP